MENNNAKLYSFGFATTAAAQNLVNGVIQALSRAAEAGLTGAPAYPAYAPAMVRKPR